MTASPIAYLNGQILPAAQASLPVSDSGLVLGATVSEFLRTFRHQPFRLKEHLARMRAGLNVLGVKAVETWEALEQTCLEVARHNTSLVPTEDDLGLICFVTPGPYATIAELPSGAAIRPTVCVHTFKLPWLAWAEKYKTGVRLTVSNVQHVPAQSVPRQIKHRSRMHYFLAEQLSRRDSPGSVPILTNARGHLLESPTANLLLVNRGKLISPPEDEILPGISRAATLELAGQLGISVECRPIQACELADAEEAILTSTPYCVLPATQVDDLKIADGKPGPIYRKLLAAWNDLVGLGVAEQMARWSKST